MVVSTLRGFQTLATLTLQTCESAGLLLNFTEGSNLRSNFMPFITKPKDVSVANGHNQKEC